MALKDTWVDKKNNDDYIDANDINMVAGAVIENEKNKADKNSVYTKEEIDNKIGSIDTALDELHAYATSLIGGEA